MIHPAFNLDSERSHMAFSLRHVSDINCFAGSDSGGFPCSRNYIPRSQSGPTHRRYDFGSSILACWIRAISASLLFQAARHKKP